MQKQAEIERQTLFEENQKQHLEVTGDLYSFQNMVKNLQDKITKYENSEDKTAIVEKME